MDDSRCGWEAKLAILTPEQREHVLEWLQDEEETWAEREEGWQKVRQEMLAMLD